MLPLNANRFRYAHENASKILCSVCETETEDEVHFICFCSLYSEPSRKYIHRYFQTEHSFTLLMQCRETLYVSYKECVPVVLLEVLSTIIAVDVGSGAV